MIINVDTQKRKGYTCVYSCTRVIAHDNECFITLYTVNSSEIVTRSDFLARLSVTTLSPIHIFIHTFHFYSVLYWFFFCFIFYLQALFICLENNATKLFTGFESCTLYISLCEYTYNLTHTLLVGLNFSRYYCVCFHLLPDFIVYACKIAAFSYDLLRVFLCLLLYT